jgi:hypothetical protein
MKNVKSILMGLVLGLCGVQVCIAGEIFDTNVNTHTGLNKGSAVIGGTVQGVSSTADRWVGQVFAGANECLRLHVTRQGTDLETLVVHPNGTVSRNDDGGVTACPLCPLVKIQPTVRGWYTVSIGSFSGAAVVADFTLRYGRYNNGNPNCASPTTPLVAERAAKPSAAASPAPKNGPGQ